MSQFHIIYIYIYISHQTLVHNNDLNKGDPLMLINSLQERWTIVFRKLRQLFHFSNYLSRKFWSVILNGDFSWFSSFSIDLQSVLDVRLHFTLYVFINIYLCLFIYLYMYYFPLYVCINNYLSLAALLNHYYYYYYHYYLNTQFCLSSSENIYIKTLNFNHHYYYPYSFLPNNFHVYSYHNNVLEKIEVVMKVWIYKWNEEWLMLI